MQWFSVLLKKNVYQVGSENSIERQEEPQDLSIKYAYLFHKLKSLMHVSTWQGVPNMARARSRVVRYTWITLFVISFGYAIFNTVITLMSYCEQQTVIRYEKRQEVGTLVFPSLTFCNLSPYNTFLLHKLL
jgi:hypothetical protein